MSPSASVVIVNYGTPRLTRAAMWSVRSHYPDLEVVVVDNASPDGSAEMLEAAARDIGRATLHRLDHNAHHGPGMDYGIRAVESDWVILLDSDCLICRRGAVEALLEAAVSEGAYMAGRLHWVDDDGFDGGRTPYVHPHFALVHRATYLSLPPFGRHGAPCLHNERAAVDRSLRLVHVPVDQWSLHIGQGTVSRYGYGLPMQSRLRQLRRTVRRLVGL